MDNEAEFLEKFKKLCWQSAKDIEILVEKLGTGGYIKFCPLCGVRLAIVFWMHTCGLSDID
jgi:hypothetical protein